MSTKPRVLIVDDALDIQLIARKALESGFEVFEAHNLKDADQRLTESGIDLVILDVTLPDGNGIDFCRKLTQGGSKNSPPVILLTSKGELSDKLDGFAAGAEDYVVKPFDPAELNARALLRLRGRMQPASGISEKKDGQICFGDIEFDPKGNGVTIDARSGSVRVDLTHREFQLLLCLARAGGRILSRDLIITNVWDSESEITGRTVDTHICKLRKKISPSRFTIHSVYGAGYRFVEPAEPLHS